MVCGGGWQRVKRIRDILERCTHRKRTASNSRDRRSAWLAAMRPVWDSLVRRLCTLAGLASVQLRSPGACYRRCACEAAATRCRRRGDTCPAGRSHCSGAERSTSSPCWCPSTRAAGIPAADTHTQTNIHTVTECMKSSSTIIDFSLGSAAAAAPHPVHDRP